jgi:hypothetical protein
MTGESKKKTRDLSGEISLQQQTSCDSLPALKYILLTFLDGRVRKSQDILEQLQAHYGQQLCPPIRYSVRLSEAPGYGQPIYEYAPGSPGAVDYQRLTEKVASNSWSSSQEKSADACNLLLTRKNLLTQCRKALLSVFPIVTKMLQEYEFQMKGS